MRLSKQYEELAKLRKYIDEVLQSDDKEKLHKMIAFLDKNDMYKKLAPKDTPLYMLSNFMYIYVREQQELINRGIDVNIFEGVASLDDLERKYLMVEFAVLRFETDMPDEMYEDAIVSLIESNISGIAICRIIMMETARKCENITAIARLLKVCKEYPRAIVLLQDGIKNIEDCDDLKLELADIWLTLECFDEAYKLLIEIENKSGQIVDIIEKLEGIVNK